MTALESEGLKSQHEREVRCSEGSSMLIGEGSNASPIRHSEGSDMLIGDPLR